ncbi:DUF1294 domain-containing protein [Marinomonas posidonica]|uniref:Cold-shock DNA-binding domain protein n=1 Tax=Marinomonas posidonica (strain CECT 7376 / NCIMB 14433 / IVIA-Po-181) TaxID=491952 RepID=F6CUC9_MARPP|nr:DUF1294 domain-containing protein [Marinomonas posidonica]AEF55248.1 protein of unknown function DUF1294 [Marinomonas posidonica IVIA-Po-181]
MFSLVVAWYGFFSLLAILAYGFDKYAAIRGHWRVQESTLHLLSVLGGWIGALMAQGVFRHKLSKKRFMLVFWGSVFVNLLGLVLVLSQWLAFL